jgi:hypothetical protein
VKGVGNGLAGPPSQPEAGIADRTDQACDRMVDVTAGVEVVDQPVPEIPAGQKPLIAAFTLEPRVVELDLMGARSGGFRIGAGCAFSG